MATTPRQRSAGISRRRWLAGCGLAAAGAALAAARPRSPIGPPRPKVAAIITAFTYRSHAHVLLENFLERYYFNGRPTDPGCEVVSLYVDQFPEGEMARDVAMRYQLPIYPTIAGALGLGGDRLAVDAVLAIGEHGTYPVNAKGQMEYPRKRFFDECVAVFERAGRGVPYFNDKHLSYRADWALEMAETAKRLGFPMMAGSSVPLATRRPPMDLPPGAAIVEAVSVHGGPAESYDFHGLEVLQSLMEGRKGGETGVKSVQFLQGDALWQAADAGRWSPALADAALTAELGPGAPSVRALVTKPPFDGQPPHAILLDYADGTKGAALRLGSSGTRWLFAARVEGEPKPLATSFYVGPWDNRNLFRALAHAIQVFYREGAAPYPFERTLLTTVALDAAMDSRAGGGIPVATPALAGLSYAARDFRPVREMGATWEILTEETPQPPGIDDRLKGSAPRPD